MLSGSFKNHEIAINAIKLAKGSKPTLVQSGNTGTSVDEATINDIKAQVKSMEKQLDHAKKQMETTKK